MHKGKMTFQPKNRQRNKVHGFRENEHSRRKKSTCCKKIKRKKEIISIGRIFVAFSSTQTI